LLLPLQLINRIDAERRAALIAHELAHWRRGDYLVRWLELIVTAAFWWDPLVWLARRELREAEEQLCDAWVVWVLPDARRAYAAALVDTVEYLSERSPLRPALPPLASGFGEVRNLKRRIVMIMSGRGTRRLSPRTLAMGLSLAAGLLAFTPSWADEPGQPPVPPTPPAAPRPEARALPPRNLDPEQAEEADRIRQSMRKMHEQLQRMEARLAEIEGRPTPRVATGRRVESATAPALPPGAPAAPGEAPRARGAFSGGFGGGSSNGFGGPGPGAGGFPGGGAGGPGGAFGGGPNVERRMDEMQRALEQLSRELSEMRRAMQDQRGRGRSDGRPGAGAAGPAAPSAPTPPPGRSEATPPPKQ
jgi:hypothetical protein